MSQEQVNHWQSKFRILKDWDIVYDVDDIMKSQCNHSASNKKASIFENTVNEADYFFHEILHICDAHLRFLNRGTYKPYREASEEFVQDLCIIVFEDRGPEYEDLLMRSQNLMALVELAYREAIQKGVGLLDGPEHDFDEMWMKSDIRKKLAEMLT